MNETRRAVPSVESYFRSVGIRADQDENGFWERLRKRYGPLAEHLAQAISAREEGQEVDVYALKNTTLPLSIAVTAQYCSRMYREFLGWFLHQRFPGPRALMDVGCDNGILTCFYAALYREAEVVGVDRGAAGIACARELAERLGLTNVRFEVRDLLGLAGAFPDRSFDCMVSTTVFHEVLGFPEGGPGHRGRSLEDGAVGAEESASVKVVTDLVRLLPDEVGTVISMERCPDATTLAWWIRVLNRAGLSVVPDRSGCLKFCDADGAEEMLPIVVAVRDPRPAAPARQDMLAFPWYDDDEDIPR
ncbi:MAG: class I SAM-dependent methyltransferase [Candidatus Methylomirabilales bacterium]